MKTLTISLSYLDKVAAIIVGQKLDVVFNNDPREVIGSVKVLRNECIGELELEDDVDENLFFYYISLNTEDGGFWFTGINLSNKFYPSNPTMRLKEKIIN